MSSTVIIIAVGIGVASFVAFGATVLMPGGESSAPEDRLAEMAARRRGRGGGRGNDPEEGSLLMAGGFDDAKGFLNTIVSNMPGPVRLPRTRPGCKCRRLNSDTLICMCRIRRRCVVLCVISPVPILLAPIMGALFAAVARWVGCSSNANAG